MRKYYYIGCFYSLDELLGKIKYTRKNPLQNLVWHVHSTFQFKPQEVNERLFGEKIIAKVIGYGNNGKNEGLLVELQAENEELQKMISEITVPHITIAVSKGARAVDTKNLDFQPIEPFYITGVFGGFVDNQNVITSFDEE